MKGSADFAPPPQWNLKRGKGSSFNPYLRPVSPTGMQPWKQPPVSVGWTDICFTGSVHAEPARYTAG